VEYQDLERDAARVLQELTPAERQVRLRTGELLVVRLRTYRTAEDKIDGVVITFVKPIDGA